MKPLAVCAIFKNEAPYVLEWIAYHRAIGFDHLVLYDNDSSDGGAELIRSSWAADTATVIHWPDRPGQLSAYRHFIHNFAAGFEWAAFIDLDEFLLPLHGGSIAEMLRSWPEFSAVLVHWRVFGPSGWSDPPDGLVIENYHLRSADDMPVNCHVKSIVRCADLVDVTTNPHEFQVKGRVCDTLGREVSNIAIQPTPCHANLVVNHYITRSRHDWMAKIRRGSAMFDYDGPKYEEERFDHFAAISHVEDTGIQAFAPGVRALLDRMARPADPDNDEAPAGATASMSDNSGQKQIAGLTVSSQMMTLDAGLFSLSLIAASHDERSGLPAVRVSLPPGLAGRKETASISTFRGDGWLTADDEPTLIRVASGGAQVMATIYAAPAPGEAYVPRLQLLRLNPGSEGGASPSTTGQMRELIGSRSAEIIAHIQDVGDVEGRLGEWIGTPRSGRWIEGFSISPQQGILPEEIEYRAVLGRDWLSPWQAGGAFCGSRGLALPLRGFGLQLRGAALAKYDCAYSARFVDGSEIGLAPANRVCVAATLAPLEAFQVVLRPRSG
jgi:hypothetical protein